MREPAEPDPTPEEIRAACEQIQAGWSEQERALRWRIAHSDKHDYRALPEWTPPTVGAEAIVA